MSDICNHDTKKYIIVCTVYMQTTLQQNNPSLPFLEVISSVSHYDFSNVVTVTVD